MKPSIAIALLLLLVACASSGWGLRPGESTESDVRRSMGTPALELSGPGAGRTLVYPTGPLGLQTFMATIDGGGKLRSIEQVLDEEHFMRIQTGTSTREDVTRIIGPPSRTLDFPRKNQVAWTYRFRDVWGYFVDMTVSFDAQGIVAEKASVRIDPSRNSNR